MSLTDGTVLLAKGKPAQVVDIYAEPLCPPCADFQQRFGTKISAAVAAGKIGVRVHLMNFLDPQSGSRNYSSRAVAALLCVAGNADPTSPAFVRFEATVFSRTFQPVEGASKDHTDAELAKAAAAAGADTATLACITGGRALALAETSDKESTKSLDAAGGGGTPSVLRNGTPLDLDTDWLTPLMR